MFSPAGAGLHRGWPGRVEGDRVVQLAAQTLQAFFSGGGAAREHASYPLEECALRPPVLHPPSVRVFSPFERRSEPFFSFTSPFPVLGPGEELASPPASDELVYGLGAAAVVGAGGAIGGFTLANVWTARDLARTERAAGFGPSKSADFGLSLGPLVVTSDEFAGGVLRARVNGVERSRADLAELAYPWGELAAHAAAGTALRPGELLVALAPLEGAPALAPGDLVELEHAEAGVLRTRVGAPRAAG
jgi:2-keto-4-pentenoate hydratase/2-oxohepta-3-ene-1,7-dioic acid hydratase in catechol pathway